MSAAVPADLGDNPQDWPTWRRFLPRVLVTTDPHRTLTGAEQDMAWLLNRAGSYLETRGELAPARSLFERSLDLRRFQLGDDHPRTLTSAHNLAAYLGALGQYEQARQLGEDTLIRRRRVLGDDHPITLTTVNNLVASLWALGQHDHGRQLGEATLNRMRRALGDDHPQTLRAARGLAAVLGREAPLRM